MHYDGDYCGDRISGGERATAGVGDFVGDGEELFLHCGIVYCEVAGYCVGGGGNGIFGRFLFVVLSAGLLWELVVSVLITVGLATSVLVVSFFFETDSAFFGVFASFILYRFHKKIYRRHLARCNNNIKRKRHDLRRR